MSTPAHLYITDHETGKDRYVESGDLPTISAKASDLFDKGKDAWIRPTPFRIKPPRHPVDALKALGVPMSPEFEAQARAICDEVVELPKGDA